MNRFVLIVFLVAGLLCSVDPGPVAGVSAVDAAETSRDIPPWLTIENAQDCAEGCWRVDSLIFEDSSQSGGNHHVYVQTRDQGGVWTGDQPFHVAYPGGDDRALSKLPPDWGNIPVWACFSPEAGEVGPYWVYGGDAPTRSDIVRGVGLPKCQHVNVRVVFRYQEQMPLPPCATGTCKQVFVPVILHNER